MNPYLLTVSGVGKSYRKYCSEWHRTLSWFGASGKPPIESWVLRGISFLVLPGESVGIIGKNGAGKSTLLKLISGAAQATEGKVHLKGRIAAILELGMGFNPEFTGRQNASHAVGLMGYSRKEIDGVISEIEAFAEIGEYFDKPMRIYSSGMQIRVAFSVATAFRPDLLIIDEALSVGDAYFQHKCFAKIQEFQKAGTTLLFVSHDSAAVLRLCNRAILLDKGRLIKDGFPQDVLDYYNALLTKKDEKNISIRSHHSGKKQTISGTGEVRIQDVVLNNDSGKCSEYFKVGEMAEICVRVKVFVSIPSLVLGYLIKDRLGQFVYGTNTHYTKQLLKNLTPGQTVQYKIRFPMNFGPGTYSISLALVPTYTHLDVNYEWKDLALMFTITNLNHPTFIGIAWVPPIIEVQA